MQYHRLCRRATRLYVHPCILLCFLLAGLPAVTVLGADYRPEEVSARQTISLYQNIPGLSSEQLEFGSREIRKISYNSQRIFRKICTMAGVNFAHAKEALDLLNRERLSFEQVLTYEAWSSLGSIEVKLGLSTITTVKSLGYEAGRSFRQYLTLPGVGAQQALSVIPLVNGLDDANNLAALALFSIKGLSVQQALDGLSSIVRLKTTQARAAEAYAKIAGMNAETMRDGLQLIEKLNQDDAWNARCLFVSKAISPKSAWDWLVKYFALPPEIQEAQYDKLDRQAKTVLLQAFYDGGQELIWKINNYHAITDEHGFEISEAALRSSSIKQLNTRFDLLPPQVKFKFGQQVAQASAGGQQGRVVELLRQATSAARVHTARALSTANAYAVLAQGSELYDSSFRDILVPVLQERIANKFHGDLLTFLRQIDPDNQLASDFIVSCAQKGKLTAFFPTDSGKQQEILQLVAASAFRDEDSILLFSATLSHLLKVLEPGARSYLISIMAKKTETDNTIFARLVNVILQYYLQTYPELLGPADRTLISRMVVRNGALNLDKYQVTPFSEWKRDGRIGSVSMFHPDDDGRQSFISNANLLLKSGYKLSFSPQYTLVDLTPALESQFRQQVAGAASNPAQGLANLFVAMHHRHFAVAFEKKIGPLTLVHTQSVYSNKENQKQMLTRFISSGDEMLAQRGHSYWRSEQIIEPMNELLEKEQISPQELRKKQRFLSLGSCGGVKAYTNLTRMFGGAVDILATIGTGLALINDPYNKAFFEIIAGSSGSLSWKGIAQQSAFIFEGGRGQDYLQPGSLTAILHKILDESQQGSAGAGSTAGNSPARDRG